LSGIQYPSPSGGDRLRILLVSEACDPDGRAGFLIGWAQAQALRRVADVHIVTESASRAGLARAGLVEGTDFTIVTTTPLKRARDGIRDAVFGRGSERGWGMWQALSLPANLAFEWRVWRKFRKALSAGAFDVVHRIVPISPDQSSILSTRLPRTRVPLVVGPLNGGLPWPEGYGAVRQAEGEWMSRIRGITRFVPGLTALRANAAALLLGSRDMMARNPHRFRERAIYLPENGIDPARFSVDRPERGAGPLRLAYVGRLVPYKGPDLALAAAADLLRDGRATMRIVGSGPMRDALEEEVRRLGVAPAVYFTGDIPHTQVQRELAAADLMLAPSIREFGGGAVLEALYMGAVPAIVDYGGPPEFATRDCGFLIPLGPRDAIIAGLRAVLERVAADPSPLPAMSQAGRARARALFEWDAKARMLVRVYRWVLGREPEKPDFGMPLSLGHIED